MSLVDKLGAVFANETSSVQAVQGGWYTLPHCIILQTFSSIEKTEGGQDRHTRFPPYSFFCFMLGPVGVKD